MYGLDEGILAALPKGTTKDAARAEKAGTLVRVDLRSKKDAPVPLATSKKINRGSAGIPPDP